MRSLFHREEGRGDQRRRTGCTKNARGVMESLASGRPHQVVTTRHEPAEQALGVVHRGEAEATRVAHPPLVDVGVEHGADALDIAAAQDLDADRATAAALGTGRRRLLQVPDARLEAERLQGQGPHRTDVGQVALVVARQGTAREGRDVGVRGETRVGQLGLLRDLLLEAHAARAQDAALLVEHDDIPEINALLQGGPGLARAALGLLLLEGVVLQGALAGLVADRAVEGVVLQQELKALTTDLVGPGGLGVDHHALADLGAAGRHDATRTASFGDLHLADPAGAHGLHGGVIAVARNVDFRIVASRDQRLGRIGFDLASIYGDLDHAWASTVSGAL